MLHNIFLQLMGNGFVDAIQAGMNRDMARTYVIMPAFSSLLLIIVIALLPAFILRFAFIRKPSSKKTALALTCIVGVLSLIPGATIYKTLGIPLVMRSGIALATLFYTYPILRCGSSSFLNLQLKMGKSRSLEFLFVLYIIVPTLGFMAGFISGVIAGVLSSTGSIHLSTGSYDLIGGISGGLMQIIIFVFISIKIHHLKEIPISLKSRLLIFSVWPLTFVLGGWLAYLIPIYFATLTDKSSNPELATIPQHKSEDELNRFTKWKN